MTDAPAKHRVVVVRHGETEWSRSGQHTGRTDIPLTAGGRQEARALAPLLAPYRDALVLASPMSRAIDTCRLAGCGDDVQVDEDLREWDYGDYEGVTTAAIRKEHPDWSVWTGGVPGGESLAEIGARADRVIARLRAVQSDVLLFSHSHFLRVLAARWVGFEPDAGRAIVLGAAGIGVLGWEREQPVIERWNVSAGAS